MDNKAMDIIVDIDGTLTKETIGWKYTERTPRKEIIDIINGFYEAGHSIILHTSRRAIDRRDTEWWLKKHGIKYTELILEKIIYDLWIDDRCISPEQLLERMTDVQFSSKIGCPVQGIRKDDNNASKKM